MVIACSAVVMELPVRGIHDDDPLLRGGGNIDIVNADARPPNDFQPVGDGDDLFGDFGRRADGQTVIFTNNLN